MEGLIQFSNEEDLFRRKKNPAEQYFDLLVFIICILYVVTVTLTNCNLQIDSPLEGSTSHKTILLPYHFPTFFAISQHVFIFTSTVEVMR